MGGDEVELVVGVQGDGVAGLDGAAGDCDVAVVGSSGVACTCCAGLMCPLFLG